MPSTAIQSRIQAFESLRSEPRNILEEPLSPTAKTLSTIVPYKTYSHSPSPSPPNLGRKTSLVDLKDWIIDDGPKRRPPPSRRTDVSEQAAPLISLEFAPPKSRSAPPLPPKKRSFISLKGDQSAPPKRSDSLTVEHTYPPFLVLDTSNPRPGMGHAPASSISSFHSISLSDGGGTPAAVVDGDADSLAESFEHISATSSPVTLVSHDWGGRDKPPKLPARPRPAPSPSDSPPSSPVRASGSSARRMPPPPPSQSRSSSTRTSLTVSDRSSILSTATSRTSASFHSKAPSQLSRPTPVPQAARQRYEAVFVANVRARRRADKSNLLSPSNTLSAGAGRKVRKAAGWRGLSVDLITNPDENVLVMQDTGNGSSESTDDTDDVGSEERLDGHAVKRIWTCSKLDTSKLRDIWTDCDPDQSGSLDLESFVKGMWRIDEELRKVRLLPSLSKRPPKRSNTSIFTR